MELANHWAEAGDLVQDVRPAAENDRSDVVELMKSAPYHHVHLDWRPPVDWLGSPGFVVLPHRAAPRSKMAARLFGSNRSLQACMAVTADPPPAAWVRLACLDRSNGAEKVLSALLEQVTPWLRETAVSHVGWLVLTPWPNGLLPRFGFVQSNEIETYTKSDMNIPVQSIPPGLSIRPAVNTDMDALAEIEERAFDPLWRHSGSTLRLACRQTFSFDVAVWNGRVVGFQFSTSSDRHAHLARITIDPDAQRHGIGSALLRHAILGYRAGNLREVSLNTQIDNLPSQRLYEKFGFQATGQRLPIWVKLL